MGFTNKAAGIVFVIGSGCWVTTPNYPVHKSAAESSKKLFTNAVKASDEAFNDQNSCSIEQTWRIVLYLSCWGPK
ncbi:hypothetical protein M5689_013547 [Euphorbia peplus]|nr:hypothetical protein M5689_013547 [Euphorbia peplus]